jgi:MFS family permease
MEQFAQQKIGVYKSGTLTQYLLIFIFVILVNLMTFEEALIPTNVDPILAHFDLITRTDILGAIVAGYTITVAITTLIFGYLADKIQRINLIVLGSVFWALCAIFSFYAQTIAQFALARIFAGFGLGALMPVGFSLICDIVSSGNRSKAFAVWGIATFIGAIAGALIGSGLFAQFEQTGFNYLWQAPFLVIGVSGLIFSAVLILFPEPKRAATEDLMKDLLSKEGLAYSYRIKRADLRNIYKRKSNFWLIVNFVDTIYPGLILLWIFKYLTSSFNLEEGVLTMPLILTVLIIGLGYLLGTIIFSWLGDRKFKQGDLTARAKLCVYCAFLQVPFIAAGFIVPISEMNYWWIAILVAIGLGIDSGIGPNWYSTLVDVNVPENRGTMIATATFLDSIGRAIGQWTGGLLIAYFFVINPAQAEFLSIQAATIFLVLQIPFWIPVLKYVKGDLQEVRDILAARAKELAEKT